MSALLKSQRDFSRMSRIVGALLAFIGGCVIFFQVYGNELLMTSRSDAVVDAVVQTKIQRGTFRDPVFLVTLSYEAEDTTGQQKIIESGRRIDFERYYALSEGQTITIHYDPSDIYGWDFLAATATDRPSQYIFGVLMVVGGLFMMSLPTIVRLAVRDDDFDFNPADDVKAN